MSFSWFSFYLGSSSFSLISGSSSSSKAPRLQAQILFLSVLNLWFHQESRIFNIMYTLMFSKLFLQSRHLQNFQIQYPTTNSTSLWRWLTGTSNVTFPKRIFICPALSSVLSFSISFDANSIIPVVQAKNNWSHFEVFSSLTFPSENSNGSSFNVDWN